MNDPLLEDAGRLFEAGFMLGVVRALHTLPSPPSVLPFYEEQRANYPVRTVIERFARRAPSLSDREAGRLLARYYLFKGHVSGYTFLREYLHSLVDGASRSASLKNKAWQQLHVRYLQCWLAGKNQLEEPSRFEREQQQTLWLTPLHLTKEDVRGVDSEKGGFLNADLLLWIQHGSATKHDILVVDTSIATAGSRHLNTDFTIGGELLRMLVRDVNYLAEKGAFSRLAIETGGEIGSLLSTPHLTPYFRAFASSDKESSKLIQAASYAQGFSQFAQAHDLLGKETPLTFHVVGYTGRGVSSMTLSPDQEGMLEACAQIYRGRRQSDLLVREASIEDARDRVLQVLKNKTALLFERGHQLTGKLLTQLPKQAFVEHHETLRGTFQNTATCPDEEVLLRSGLSTQELQKLARTRLPTTRDAHAALVRRAISEGRRYLFLTGNAGIGKTTSLAQYLQEEGQDGYLLLYTSPRKTVNRDIFEKFKLSSPDDERRSAPFYTDRFLGLSTNASLIQQARGQATVEYLGESSRLPERRRGVQFLTSEQADQLRHSSSGGYGPSRLASVAEDTLHEKAREGAGVLKSVCSAIGAALTRSVPNALVAAVAIQALKRREAGQDTLEHLYEMFGDAYIRRDHRFVPDRMHALAKTTRHLIIMIDEITGDDAGYEFFRRVAVFLRECQLEHYGFRPIILVSDASIVGIEVLRAHLGLLHKEPDARKIYLTVAPAKLETSSTDAVSILPFSFEKEGAEDAYLVNANSFPASALHMHYKVRMPLLEVTEERGTIEQRARIQSAKAMLRNKDDDIAEDVSTLLENTPPTHEQILVYVQDKSRLQRIISSIEKHQRKIGRAFTLGEHYTEIHADNSESERARIERAVDRDRFDVIFMTSAASRGLTFSKAVHVLIDVALFNVEANLMEIMQVLYRGRGGSYDLLEKHVTFYLSDLLIAEAGQMKNRIREGILGLLTMLCLLKMCLLTRLSGGVTLRDRCLSLIPLGGKSVSGSGRAYHQEIANFHRALRQQRRGARANDWALSRIQKVVEKLMERASLYLEREEASYLSLYEAATADYLEEWMKRNTPIEEAYVLGNLLIVPMPTNQAETVHSLGLSDQIAPAISEETIRALEYLLSNGRNYAPAISDGAKALSQLVKELRQVQSSQRLEQRGGRQPTYYVVPLAIFVAKETIAQSCQEIAQGADGTEAALLQAALISYVRDSYPIDTRLPIGYHYRDFPFLVITSQDLSALRAKIFQKGHTLMSREMNLLSLLLSESSPR